MTSLDKAAAWLKNFWAAHRCSTGDIPAWDYLDLPAPHITADGAHEWACGHVWIDDDSGCIYTTRRSVMTPTHAEEYALALLAAAKHLKEHHE